MIFTIIPIFMVIPIFVIFMIIPIFTIIPLFMIIPIFSFQKSAHGAYLLLQPVESSLMWALISTKSSHQEFHSWVHFDGNYSNVSLGSTPLLSLSFVVESPLNGKIFELSRFIGDETLSESKEAYLNAFTLIQETVIHDLAELSLSHLLPQPSSPTDFVLSPSGLIGDSNGAINALMTSIIPSHGHGDKSRIRDCGQHFSKGISDIRRTIAALKNIDDNEKKIMKKKK